MVLPRGSDKNKNGRAVKALPYQNRSHRSQKNAMYAPRGQPQDQLTHHHPSLMWLDNQDEIVV